MNPKVLPRTDCPSRKVGYPDSYNANLALLLAWKARQASRRKYSKVEHHAYRCDRCPNWHLTSQTTMGKIKKH